MPRVSEKRLLRERVSLFASQYHSTSGKSLRLLILRFKPTHTGAEGLSGSVYTRTHILQSQPLLHLYNSSHLSVGEDPVRQAGAVRPQLTGRPWRCYYCPSCGCSWCCLPVLYCWYYCCDCRCSGCCCCCSCYYFFFVLLLLVLVLVLLQLQLLLLRQRQQQLLLLLLVTKTTTATIRLPLQLPPTTSCGDDCVRDFTFSPWMPTIGLTVQQRHHKFALKQHFHLYHARNSRVV